MRRAPRSWSKPTGWRPARVWSSPPAPKRPTRQSTPCSSTTAMGSAGARVVIEECLQGEEASFIVMVDGHHVLPLASSQDHKRLLDGDRGPNTGGMGAYSPAPVLTPALHARAMREVIQPVVSGMDSGGRTVHRIPLRGADDLARRVSSKCSSSTAASATRRRNRSSCASRATCSPWSSTPSTVSSIASQAEWDRRVALGRGAGSARVSRQSAQGR